jgi:hypothetical protein
MGEKKNSYRDNGGELKERDHSKDLDVGGRVILK